MKSIFYLTILLLVYDNECFITNYKNKEFIYKFSNTIIASNKASDKVVSLWTYSGILIVQEYDDCKIFQLDNVKTSIFNGIRNNLKLNETELSDDKKVLTEPFAVYFKSFTDVNISVTPNDELWSVNMKKAIASSFLIDTSLDKEKTDTEQLIFGKCGVKFAVTNSRSTKIIEKTINKTCVEGPIQHSSNVDWINSPFHHETKRTYVISKNNCLFSIDSSSNFTLQSSPDVRSTNRIEQNQYFELITTKENTKPLKILNNTITKNLIYEFPNKKNIHTNQQTYLKDFINAYTNLKTALNQKPLQFWDLSAKTPLSEMLRSLKKFDEICLRKLLLGILMGKDSQYYDTFLEILPYAGTKHTINLIKDIVKDEIDFHTKIKLLATFPEYVDEINDETVENFEEFLTYQFDKVQVKQTAVLSFSYLVSKGIERNTIGDQVGEKYMKKFYEQFLNAQNHEDKMIYLLGLINISKKVPLNAILNIIYNKMESRHIRELAMYGFKNRLKQYGEELFNKFWAIVISPSENFETRIAALDLLLSSEISEEQFNEIVNFCSKDLNNLYDEHLSNYIVTTIISLQNNTGYKYYLGDWASKILKTKKLRQNLKTWSTGNYRFSFTDTNSNFGGAIQAKLISDPKTNAINVIQFSYNHFALSMNLGELNVYFKLEGVLDLMFLKTFLSERSKTTPINELINLIQHCKYQLKDRDDVFIDFVVFSNNRVLYAMHIDQNNINNEQNIILESVLKIITSRKSITFPIINEIQIPSDLGTELKINYDMEQIKLHEYDNFLALVGIDETAKITINNKILTQMTETISSLNPLKDVKIYVKKLQHDFKTLQIPLNFDKNDRSVIWTNKNDNFNFIKQNSIYTFVSNSTILKEYCENCNEIEKIPAAESKAECVEAEKYLNQCRMDYSIWKEKIINIYPLGVGINITRGKESEEMESLRRMKQYNVHKITEIVNSHQGNAMTFPFFKPALFFSHLVLYSRYLDNDLEELSVRSSKLFDDVYITKLKLWYNKTSTKKYDPINNFDESFILEIINKDKNNYILGGAKLTFYLANIVASTNNNEIGTNFAIVADILNQNNFKKKFCLNHKMIYPNRLRDKLYIEPIEPAEGVTTISWDAVESFHDECPHYFVKLTEILSVNREKSKYIKNMNEYKTCKTESGALKFTPLTKSCKIAHKAASTYRNYEIFAELHHGGPRADEPRKSKIFEYHHIDDKTINISIAPGFTRLLEINPKPEFFNYIEPSTFANYLSKNPTESVTNNERSCDISNNGVKTFFDEFVAIDEKTQPKIAFVECTNTSQFGLTFNKIGHVNVDFTFWSGQHKISTKIVNDHEMNIYLNGNEIKENTENENLKIRFIDTNVLFITSDLVELYYSPISLSIVVPTLYYKHLCGECLQ